MIVSYFRAELRFGEMYLLRFSLVCLSLIAIPLVDFFPNQALPLAYLVSAMIIWIAGFWLTRDKRLFSVRREMLAAINWKLDVGHAALFGIPGMLVIINQFLDKQVAGVLFGSLGVGQYYAVTNLAQLLSFPMETAAGLFLPYLITRNKKDRRFRPLTVVWFGLLASLGLAIPFALLGPFVLDFLYGVGTFSNIPLVFYMAILSYAARGLSALLLCYIIAFHPPRTLVLINVLPMVAGPILMLWLGHLMALNGIALGNLIVTFLMLGTIILVVSRGVQTVTA